MTLTLTILGCGSSGGVPRIGNNWGACDPDNPKNRRRRCSILLRATRTGGDAATTVLVDTSPDMREQLNDAGAGKLDGVLYTHEHADHIHGIDDLRMVAMNIRSRVPVHADRHTMDLIRSRFGYCFETPPGSQYPPILEGHLLEPGTEVVIDGAGGPVRAMPFTVAHGDIDALGYRFGDVAYTPDINGIDAANERHLADLDIWIVDALRRTRHPSHFSLEETLSWIERIGPHRAIITNMHVDLDYQTLCGELPPHIRPAYDGMEITVTV